MGIDFKGSARRKVLSGLGDTLLFAPTCLRAREQEGVRRNSSLFHIHDWQDQFEKIGKGILLSDTATIVLQHRKSDGEMRIYPTSVPLADDHKRHGYTEGVEKRVDSGWTPTPSMRERDPELPVHVKGGDPKNPLGSRALYLSWQFYRIPGTADTRKIGRKSSRGCIGLYSEHVEEMFERSPVETQVKLL